MQGDGVRHNRAGEASGSNDSWLPGGARGFLFRRKTGMILAVNLGVSPEAPTLGGLEQTCA
jgi:hypothetical protein